SKVYLRLEDFPRFARHRVVFFVRFLEVSFLKIQTTTSFVAVFKASNKISKRISIRLHLLPPSNEERDNATSHPTIYSCPYSITE
ncbi:hypothetical protein, partial [Bacillus sp. Fil]|uniref:hypothetical protein n=1 Tax=Bacillus sp. Fil TaxID=3459567 RepID=UPI00403A7FF4